MKILRLEELLNLAPDNEYHPLVVKNYERIGYCGRVMVQSGKGYQKMPDTWEVEENKPS